MCNQFKEKQKKSERQKPTKGCDLEARNHCWVFVWADLWGAVWRGQQRSTEYEIRPLEEEDFVPV